MFSHVNIHIHCGQLTAVIGPNGAGKSTLLRAILGEIPHTGVLHYVDAKGKHTGHPIIGYVPQYLRFDVSSPTSVMDLFMACLSRRPVWLCSSKKLRPRVLRSLARVKAEYLIDRRLGALSGGELQRVLLALIDAGLSRQAAYAIVQRNAMTAWKTKRQFLELLLEDPEVTAQLARDAVRALFDYGFYLQNIGATFERLGL